MLQRTGNQRARASQTVVFPAPTAGWVQSGNVVQAPLNQAEVLDNFIPTAQGARLRGGAQEYADIGAAVVRMFTYVSGDTTELFAATASRTYNADRIASGTYTVLGSDLITNGAFSSDGAGWTFGDNWEVADVFVFGTDWAARATSANETAVSQPLTLTEGKRYRIKFDIQNRSNGSVKVRLTGSTPVDGEIIAFADEVALLEDVEVFLTANSTSDGVAFVAQNNFSGAIDDVSVVEVEFPRDHGDLEGLSSGDWAASQISTSGGQFSVAVNGTDHAIYWDGTEFNPITTVAVNEIPFDAETGEFTVGDTVTGGTSGASAEILAITKTSATAGKLKVGTITSGPFQDNEALTDGSTGAATAAGASASASSITITNVATKDLSQVWLFKERLFFVEKGTTSAWYLPVESIGGAATELDLGSVFSKGGSLLFGARWSLDSGAGLDDVCLFVSDRGEIAVYEGTDPSSADTWRLAGVYEIGDPVNKHGFFKAGGDLAILTRDGIIPVSAAVTKDRAALQLDAITYPIEDAWREAITSASNSNPVSVSLWQSGALLLVGTPQADGGKPVSFVANARTGAWGRVTGWDVICSAVADDQLFFGTSAGKIMRADTGGTDGGTEYTGVYVPKFKPSNDIQVTNAASLTYRAPELLSFDMAAHADYTVSPISTPPATSTFDPGTWGTGVWGTFVWGSGADLNSYTEWQSVASQGYAHAPSVAITSSQTSAITFEVQVMRLRTERGYAL